MEVIQPVRAQPQASGFERRDGRHNRPIRATRKTGVGRSPNGIRILPWRSRHIPSATSEPRPKGCSVSRAQAIPAVPDRYRRLRYISVTSVTAVGSRLNGAVTPPDATACFAVLGHSLRRGFITKAAKKKISGENIKRVTGSARTPSCLGTPSLPGKRVKAAVDVEVFDRWVRNRVSSAGFRNNTVPLPLRLRQTRAHRRAIPIAKG